MELDLKQVEFLINNTFRTILIKMINYKILQNSTSNCSFQEKNDSYII